MNKNSKSASKGISNSPLDFARFEFKYILSERKRKLIEEEMKYFVELDPFVASRSNYEYSVRSLYYDDPAYTCFHDKIGGMCTRAKFRIRTYPTAPATYSPTFLEIKGRHNNLVFKHRVPINTQTADFMSLRGDSLSNAVILNADESAVRNQFQFELVKKRLFPIALIDYNRRPYISKFDPDFRVTFDRSLAACHTDFLQPDKNFPAKQMLAGHTVLEVKFLHHLPSWFHRLLQVHELQRVSISKICAGMEKLGLATDENN